MDFSRTKPRNAALTSDARPQAHGTLHALLTWCLITPLKLATGAPMSVARTKIARALSVFFPSKFLKIATYDTVIKTNFSRTYLACDASYILV